MSDAGAPLVAFVMSPSHGGSTLLDLILGSHSGGFSLGELDSVSRRIGGGDALCGVCEKACPIWDREDLRRFLVRYFAWGASGRPLLRRLDAALGAYRGDLYGAVLEATGATLLVDSGKRVGWIRRQLRPSSHWRDRQAHLVFLHRDGRAIVNSLLRKYPERGVERIARDWADTIGAMERYFDAFPAERRTRIAYETLASEPRRTIEELCSRLGIDFEPAMLAYWRHDHHIVHGNAGTRSLIHRYRAGDTGDDEAAGDEGFYEKLGLGIRLDERWREELDRRDLAAFEAVAGTINRRYARPPSPTDPD